MAKKSSQRTRATRKKAAGPKRGKPAQAEQYQWIAADLRPLATPILDVAPDEENARRHSRANVKAIARSLRQFGQVKPIVANRQTGRIEAGNGTYMAAQELEWTHLAVVWVEHDPDSARGFSIADNRTAELATWDIEALLAQLPTVEETFGRLYADLDLERFKTKPAENATETEGSEETGETGETGSDDDDAATEDPVPETYEVVVHCKDQEDQRQFFEEMQAAGRDCRLLTM